MQIDAFETLSLMDDEVHQHGAMVPGNEDICDAFSQNEA